MNCTTPDLPVPHHLLKFAQVHAHCISDAIQPSHPLTPSSPSALSLSQGLFQWVGCSHQVIKVLELKLASVLPIKIQGWFPLRLTGLISLLSTGLSGVFSSTTVWRHQFFGALPSLRSSSHNHTWLLGRPQPWLYGSLSAMSLLFNTLSRCVIAFLPRSNRLLISRLQSTSAVILEPKKRKSVTTSTFSPSICHEWGQMPRS